MNFVLSMTLICITIAWLMKERMKKSYHEFCAVDDPHLHYHRLADDEPAASVDAPLTATPVVWITPPSIDFRRGLRL